MSKRIQAGWALLLVGWMAALVGDAANGEAEVTELQAQLLEQIVADAWETRGYTGRAQLSQRVLDVMAAVAAPCVR